MNILITILFLIVIYYLFIHNKTKDENFSGSGTDNPFSNLTCITDINGKNHILKVSPSLNSSKPYYTYHKLLHPDRLLKTDGSQYVGFDDIVKQGDQVPCDDSKFSAYYVKSIRDQNSNARRLFNKINANTKDPKNTTWKTHECTTHNIKDPNHWCGKIHNSINTNHDKICSTKIGTVPASYCSSFDDPNIGLIANIATDNLNTLNIPYVNNLVQNGIPCTQGALNNIGMTIQEYTDPVTGIYYCLKDNDKKLINSTGSMCINKNTNITPYNPIVNGSTISCNIGDQLQSSICINASGVPYPQNADGTCNGQDNTDSVCAGTPLFNSVNNTITSPLYGTVPMKFDSAKCNLDGSIKVDSKGKPLAKSCTRQATTSEIDALQKSPWYQNLVNQFAACAVKTV